MNKKELLEKALIGEVIQNYFQTYGQMIILSSRVHSNNKQGNVLCFKDDFCWKIVYSISENNGYYEFELVKELSGIMDVTKLK